MNPRFFLLLALITLCVCAFPQAAQEGLPPAGKLQIAAVLPLTVPYDIWQGMITVPVAVGGGRPIPAVIATNLPLCVATPELAVNRKIAVGAVGAVPGLYGALRVNHCSAQNVQIAQLMLSDAPFAISDLLAQLTQTPKPDPPQVWLGASFLAALRVTMDPLLHTVTFAAPSASMPKKATVVPFMLKDGRIWVEAKAEGKQTYQALVDTTAVGSLLPATVARALKLQPLATMQVHHPNGKSGTAGAASLKELSLGPLKLKGVQALYLVDPEPSGMDPALGIIGLDLLMRYRVTIDYTARKIAFEKPEPPKPALPLPKPPPAPEAPKPGTKTGVSGGM